MKFCIATIDFWHAVGFDTAYWRKSVDGINAICHDKFAKTLIGDVGNNPNIEVYGIDDPEFQQILEDEFTEREE